MCCFIPWQGQGLWMFLASECGRSRAQSARSIFRSVLQPYTSSEFRCLVHRLTIHILTWHNKFALIQVEVPTSGSETIECGVCQHPFLVSARWTEFSFSRHAVVESYQIHKRKVSPVQSSLMLNAECGYPCLYPILHGVCRSTVYMDELSRLQIC